MRKDLGFGEEVEEARDKVEVDRPLRLHRHKVLQHLLDTYTSFRSVVYTYLLSRG